MDTNQKSNPFSLTTMEQLREIYKAPSGRTIDKEYDYITPPGRKMIEKSSLIMLATSGPNGADCSPKGDGPGFVYVLDEKTVAIPDRPGNNRLDGMQNVVENPQVGVLFLVPGSNITYLMLVHVEQAFSHCPKAFVRSNVWKEGAKGAPEGTPTHGDFAKFVEGATDDDFVEKFNEAYKEREKKELYGDHK
jgi:predicted pyridoxine 5'-phosphate oxidase superfamily flavin-nucleotide-binding protein